MIPNLGQLHHSTEPWRLVLGHRYRSDAAHALEISDPYGVHYNETHGPPVRRLTGAGRGSRRGRVEELPMAQEAWLCQDTLTPKEALEITLANSGESAPLLCPLGVR